MFSALFMFYFFEVTNKTEIATNNINIEGV